MKKLLLPGSDQLIMGMITGWMLACAFVIGVSTFSASCAHAPASITTPAGQQAWNQLEVQKDLDLIRDLAQAGASQTPPVISVMSATVVTAWHKTAIQIVHDAPTNWKQAVLDGLVGLQANLPAADYAKIQIYVSTAYAVVKGLP